MNLIHIITISFLFSLLPDIDHYKSFLGNKIKYVSVFIYNYLGHRKLTHSLFFIILLYFLLFNINDLFMLSLNTKYGIIIGCLSHILADMFTYRGIKLLWPLNLNFRFPIYFLFKNKFFEYYFCVFLLFNIIFLKWILYLLNIIKNFLFNIMFYV